MGFAVRLVHDVDPELRRQLVKNRLIGIVGASDGVQTRGFDVLQLLFDLLRRDRPAGERVVLVPVDALEGDRASVHQQEMPFDLGFRDSRPLGVDLRHRAVFDDLDGQGVEIRSLRVPRHGVLERQEDLAGGCQRAFGGGNVIPVHIGQREPQGSRIPVRVAGSFYPESVRVREDRVIPEGVSPGFDQHDVPEDAACHEHILVFEVRRVAVSADLDREEVFPVPELVRHVELRRDPAPLREADVRPVEPYEESVVHPAEAQDRPAFRLFRVKGPPVQTDRVRAVDERRIVGEAVADVRVEAGPVPVKLPHRRHGKIVPARVVKIRREESLVRVLLPIGEFPRSVQKFDAVGFPKIPVGDALLLCGDQQGPGGQAVFLSLMRISEIGAVQHEEVPPNRCFECLSLISESRGFRYAPIISRKGRNVNSPAGRADGIAPFFLSEGPNRFSRWKPPAPT